MSDDDEYILPLKTISEAIQLRNLGKFTLAEIAAKLKVSLDDLRHDLDLRHRELMEMDD